MVMGTKLEKLRSKAVLASVGAALLLTGVGVGTGYAVTGTSPGTRTVSDDSAVTEPEAPSSAEATDVVEPTQEQPPAVQPEPVAPTSSVARVPSNQQPAPKADPKTGGEVPPAPPGYDPAARFTDSSGTVYQPAPDVPVEPLPGEPNYVPPSAG